MTVVTWHCQTIHNEVSYVHISKVRTAYFHLLLEIYVYVRMLNETGIYVQILVFIYLYFWAGIFYDIFYDLWLPGMFLSFPNLDRLGQV